MTDLARPALALVAIVATLAGGACGNGAPPDRVRVSGHVEATDVEVAAEVGGRVLELAVDEGARVSARDLIARLDTADTELLLRRVRAERDQAEAQLRLLRAGSRREDVRQASAQHQASTAEVASAEAELQAAEADLERYEALLASRAGSQKQRDDARARRDVALARREAARERARASREAVMRLEAGARPEELDAAAARLAAADAQIASLEKQIQDATVRAPVAGVVTSKLVSRGELLAPRAPMVVITDLEHAWANVFVDQPFVSRLRLGQQAKIFPDASGEALPGSLTFISPRAEFTPRNVQTAEERSRLVYRVKITVDNHDGILKPGMPVEAELPFQ